MRSLGSRDSLTVDEALKESLTGDYKKAAVSDLDRLILSYAEKITREAHTIDQAYIDSLKVNGLDDRMLHDIVQSTAYFNYVNRLADGLGVELETDEEMR